MKGLLDKKLVLSLNANWQPIGTKSVKDAIIQLNSDGDNVAVALDINYELDADGDPILSDMPSMAPFGWEDWVQLPIRSWDLVIRSQHHSIRVPTVTIAKNFNKMPFKTFRPTNGGIFTRDGGVCQYSGKKLPRSQLNVDHIIPQSKGGQDTWENQVLCDRKLNSKKGNKSNKEAGLTLIRKPSAPRPVPLMATITEAAHADWGWFLTHKKKAGLDFGNG
jgi:5-methylcytosine-specific restriction endonuclease McrA